MPKRKALSAKYQREKDRLRKRKQRLNSAALVEPDILPEVVSGAVSAPPSNVLGSGSMGCQTK